MTSERPPSYLLRQPVDLRHLTRRDALGQLADAAMHRDWAIGLCFERLPLSALEDYEMRTVFYTLWGRWSRGGWDDTNNLEYIAATMAVKECQSEGWFTMPRDRLVLELNVGAWLDVLDGWYCPWTVSRSYVEALIDGLHEEDQVIADTAQLSVRERLYGGPFAVDTDLEDAVYHHISQLVAMRRGHRLAKVALKLPAKLPAPKPETDWEGLIERVRNR